MGKSHDQSEINQSRQYQYIKCDTMCIWIKIASSYSWRYIHAFIHDLSSFQQHITFHSCLFVYKRTQIKTREKCF